MGNKDDIIADLRRIIDAQSKRINELNNRVGELELAKALKNSSNSSKSPSSDIVKPPKKKADRRKKTKRGGQKGHQRKLREPLPPERVNETFIYEMNDADVNELSLTPTGEMKQAIPVQPHLGTNESSFKNNGKKHWIWCISAAMFSFFRIATTRSRSVLEEVIGPDYRGVVHCDYFSANCSFIWNFDIKGQYCWAHLIRDIRFLLKHPDKRTKAWAEELQNRSRKVFSSYHRREEMSEPGFHRSMLIQRDRFLEIVRKPPDSQEARNLTDRFRIVEFSEGEKVGSYDLSQDYFRFMFEDNVEPTNNHSEQQIRHWVIDRKITQGTRSQKGQRYHERMWTVIATCRKQNRSFFQFLRASIEAKMNGTPTPSLLHIPPN